MCEGLWRECDFRRRKSESQPDYARHSGWECDFTDGHARECRGSTMRTPRTRMELWRKNAVESRKHAKPPDWDMISTRQHFILCRALAGTRLLKMGSAGLYNDIGGRGELAIRLTVVIIIRVITVHRRTRKLVIRIQSLLPANFRVRKAS